MLNVAYGDTMGQIGIIDIGRECETVSRKEHHGIITSLSYSCQSERLLVSGSADKTGTGIALHSVGETLVSLACSVYYVFLFIHACILYM